MLERKSLADLITTLMQNRERFFKSCERLSMYRWRALLVEASYEDIKSPYDDGYTEAHPNAVSGSLDALEAKFGIPVIYTSQFRPLAEEKAASCFLNISHIGIWKKTVLDEYYRKGIYSYFNCAKRTPNGLGFSIIR